MSGPSFAKTAENGQIDATPPAAPESPFTEIVRTVRVRQSIDPLVRVGYREARRSLSPRVRFAVLLRDQFTCQYCGRSAPDVVLHVDHVTPRAAGGSDDIENLITACQPCNLGKGKTSVDDAPDERPSPDYFKQILIAESKNHIAVAGRIFDELLARTVAFLDGSREIDVDALEELARDVARFGMKAGRHMRKAAENARAIQQINREARR